MPCKTCSSATCSTLHKTVFSISRHVLWNFKTRFHKFIQTRTSHPTVSGWPETCFRSANTTRLLCWQCTLHITDASKTNLLHANTQTLNK